MRIAHVTATFPPYYGGAGSVCYYNALGLAQLGHEVTVLTACHPPGEYDYPDEITVRRLPVLFRVGNAPFLPKLMGLKGFDIIHLHYPFIFGAEMVWATSKIRDIPYIVTHHNDLVGHGLRRHLFDGYSTLSTPLVFGGSRRLGVVSADHAKHCRLSGLFRKRWADVVEIPNGVDTNLFRPGLDGTSIRRRHGIPDDAAVVLFVGALDRAHHFKGVSHLLEAMSRLNESTTVLMLVGDGDMRDQYIAQADELGVAQRSIFVGALPHAELAFYYSAADLIVLPSSFPESFGMVLIEAMACGKPVIASNLPGVRSVVDEGESGLLVTPGDVEDLAAKVKTLLKDPDRRGEMGAQGRAKVEEEYAWPNIILRLERIYEKTISCQQPTPKNKAIAKGFEDG